MNPAHLALAAVAGLALAGRSRRGGRNDGADEDKWRTIEQIVGAPVPDLTARQLQVLYNEGRLVDTAGNVVPPADVHLFELELHYWNAESIEGLTPRVTGYKGRPVRFRFRSGSTRSDYDVPLPGWIRYYDKNLGWVDRRLPADVVLDWS